MSRQDDLFYHEEPEFAGPEKRAFLRINVNFIVEYHVYPGPVEEQESSCTLNLSRGGACFVADRFFPQGTVLHISLKLPHVARLVEVLGQVLYSTPVDEKKTGYDIGITFIRADEEDMRLVERVLSACAAQDKPEAGSA